MSADIPETDLDGERLLLGVVNNATQRLVGKAAVALRGMMPGRHYNLKLLLDTSGSVHLTGAFAHARGGMEWPLRGGTPRCFASTALVLTFDVHKWFWPSPAFPSRAVTRSAARCPHAVFIQNGPVTQLNYLRANPNQVRLPRTRDIPQQLFQLRLRAHFVVRLCSRLALSALLLDHSHHSFNIQSNASLCTPLFPLASSHIRRFALRLAWRLSLHHRGRSTSTHAGCTRWWPCGSTWPRTVRDGPPAMSVHPSSLIHDPFTDASHLFLPIPIPIRRRCGARGASEPPRPHVGGG